MAFRLFTKCYCSTTPKVLGSMLNSKLETQINYGACENAISDDQKIWLVDSFKRKHTYLRISLTEKCSLRCLYCMPSEGVELSPKSHILSSTEIVELAKYFVNRGIRKIRLTGGEPLVRSDCVEIVERLSELKHNHGSNQLDSITMTTNGIVLGRLLPKLVAAGLDGVNISLDTLIPAKFEFLTRRKGWEKVWQAINLSLNAGLNLPVKVNCVIMRGKNEDEILDFVEVTKQLPIDIRFIEYMPFDGNRWNAKTFFPYAEMLQVIRARHANLIRLSDSANHTAKAYQVPGYKGSLGFISSMSEHFCSTCNRLRLTANGQLKLCLFGQEEFNLRDIVRQHHADRMNQNDVTNDQQNSLEDKLDSVILKAMLLKRAKHAGMHNLVHMENRPMIMIGG